MNLTPRSRIERTRRCGQRSSGLVPREAQQSQSGLCAEACWDRCLVFLATVRQSDLPRLWASAIRAKREKASQIRALQGRRRSGRCEELRVPRITRVRKPLARARWFDQTHYRSVGRHRVKHAAIDSALGADSIVEWVPAVSTMDRARACLRQIAWRGGKPGSRPTGLNSVSSPG